MFLIAKLNLISGMLIGAAAVLTMKQMCKHERSSMPTDTPQE